MEEETKKRLTSRDIWMRALFMVFFAIVYSISELIVTLLVIFQFLTILFTGHANGPLLRFSNNLSTYIYQILQFVTFNTETQPFPFSEWPDEELGANRWLEDEESAADETTPDAPEADASADSDDDTESPAADSDKE